MRRDECHCSEGARCNFPTQRAIDMQLFELVEHTYATPDGSSFVTVTTKVTGKGQAYFMNRYVSGQP